MQLTCFAILLLSATTLTTGLPCNSLKTLEKEAFENVDGNELNLSSVFNPPRRPSAKYVRVTYSFQDEAGEVDDNCSVTYMWAKTSFLLIQPPVIFQFTSLFFNHQSGERSELSLTLPASCRHLVNTTTGTSSSCSCEDHHEDNLLIFFTHQV